MFLRSLPDGTTQPFPPLFGSDFELAFQGMISPSRWCCRGPEIGPLRAFWGLWLALQLAQLSHSPRLSVGHPEDFQESQDFAQLSARSWLTIRRATPYS